MRSPRAVSPAPPVPTSWSPRSGIRSRPGRPSRRSPSPASSRTTAFRTHRKRSTEMTDLIRVTLQADDAELRDQFERSGMVQIVDSAPDVLVWQLPQDSDGLPAEMRIALAEPHGPAVIALTDGHPARWFDEALALGVDDIIYLPQPPESLGMAAAKARGMRSRRRSQATPPAPAKGDRS